MARIRRSLRNVNVGHSDHVARLHFDRHQPSIAIPDPENSATLDNEPHFASLCQYPRAQLPRVDPRRLTVTDLLPRARRGSPLNAELLAAISVQSMTLE
jgi:hypothetical protein